MNATVFVGLALVTGIFNAWTSRLNSRFFFGRTAAAEAQRSPKGKAITRSYLTSVVLVTLAAVGLVWTSLHLGQRAFASSVILIELAAFYIVFARANGQVSALLEASPELQTTPMSFLEVGLLDQPTYWIPGILAVLLPVAVCILTFAAEAMRAAQGAGIVAGWKAFTDSLDRQGDSFTLGIACGMLTAATCTLLLFRSSVRLRTKMAQYSVRSSFTLQWIAATLLAVTLLSNQLGMTISRTMGKSLVGVALALALLILVWNQSRSKTFVPPPVELGADNRWRWGLFYVDRNDPALFVQSRCGVGYTLNYGKVAAWPISLGVLAYLVGVLFALPHLH